MTGRGRGRPRGSRGRGRGAATAAVAADSSHENASADVAPTEAAPPSTEPAASVAEASTSQPESSAAAAAAPSAQPQTSSAVPKAAPATRTAGGRGKKALTFQPTFAGRRSKEERDALKKEAWEKEKERKAEAASAASAAARARGGFRGRGDRGGRGRGGYMGDRGGSELGAGVAGPFSAGSVGKDGRRFVQRQRVGGFGGSGGHSGIKMEDGIKREDGDIEAELGIKGESHDYGYISSDPDEGEGPRWNVDEIVNLVSSEDEAESSVPSSRASSAHPKSKKAKSTPHGLMPVRVFRKEHKDRVMGINTEASSAAVAEMRKQKESGGAEVSVEDAMATVAAKGKGKARLSNDSEQKPFKGMWRDAEDAEIKKEPGTMDEEMHDIAVEDAPASPEVSIKEPPSSPEMKKKPAKAKKPRRKSSAASRPKWDAKPALQTEEERQEWARIQLDNELIVQELRHTRVSTPPATAPSGEPGTEGEASAAEGSKAQQEDLPDQKADRVYLFQLPPIVPELFPVPSEIKAEEPSSPTATLHSAPVASSGALPGSSASLQPTVPGPGVNTDAPIKIEEDAAAANPSGGPMLAPGRAGKLRVHRSGKVTLDWGGTSLALQKGMDPRFLQDVVVMKVLPEEERNNGPNGKPREGTYGGEAMSFGQVRGKFVVTPDWDEIVG